MQPPKLCIHFQRGFCSYGSNCRFIHQQFGSFSHGGGRFNGARWTQTGGRGGRSNAPYCYYQESYFQSSGSTRASVSQPAPTRDWSVSDPLQQGTSFTFRFMSWNILAAELAHTHAEELYPHAHHSCLDWPKRLAAVISHVAEQRPDVLCLQEVDDWPGLRKELAALGYDGVHVQRTGGRGDGCATLWLRDRLRLNRSPGPRSRSATDGFGFGSGSGSCGDGVHRIHMADYDLRDNVAILVHLMPRRCAGGSAPVSERAGAGVSEDNPSGGRSEGGSSSSNGSSVSIGDSSSGSDDSLEDVSEPPDLPTGRRPKRTRQNSDGGVAVVDTAADATEVAAAAVTEAIASLRPYPGGTSAADADAAAALTGLYPSAAAAGLLRTQGRQRQQQHGGGGDSGGGQDAAAGPMGRSTSGSTAQNLPRSIACRGFWIANTHVLFNTKRGDIKLGQLRVILNELARRALAGGEASAGGAGAGEGREGKAEAVPVIFAGDFNTSPGSGLYRFLRYGTLPLAGEDRRELSGQVEGYGYEQLQRDTKAGTAPRLVRWSPGPELRNPQAMWKLQQQQQQQLLTANGRSYRVRWEKEELVYAMGSVAVARAIASIREAAAGNGNGNGNDTVVNLRQASSTGAMSIGWQGRSGSGTNPGSMWRERDATAAAQWLAVTEAAVVRHPLHLRSAYAAVDEQEREPLFTTMHARYVGTVDFVWYTPGDELGGGDDGSSGSSRGADRGGMAG
ncbi:hypothetical protein Vretimale_15903, partial [Volvox reticuliferus]